MSWDYRVVRKRHEQSDEFFYGIHEAFLDDEGRAWACTEEPGAPMGETLSDLRREIIEYGNAVITANEECDCGCLLDYDLIPQEGSENPLADIDFEDVKCIPIDLDELKANWLSRTDKCECSNCAHWSCVPWSRVVANGRCMARPLGVMDKNFKRGKRYSRTRKTDWCNRWKER